MRCPHCEKDIDESVFKPPLTYCPYCGENLGASGTGGATEGILFCPHCGKELPGKVNFCPYCGGEVARRVTTPSRGLEDTEPAERRAKPKIEPPPERKKKTDKLYKQWMKYADLPPAAVPSTETPKEMPVRRDMPAGRGKNVLGVPFLYMLIGLCIIALFVLIIIVLVQSC